MPLQFDELIARLDELRVDAERARLVAAAHQLEAWIGYLRMRPATFSHREPDVYDGELPEPSGA